VVTWVRTASGSKYHVYSARLAAGATTFGPEIKVSTTTDSKDRTAVTVGADGSAYVVWTQPSTGNADIWFGSLAPGSSTWSAPAKVSDDPGTAHQGWPDIGVDGTGNVMVTWTDSRVSPNQLRVRRRPSGGSWASSSVIATAASFPSLAVRSDGRAYVTWYLSQTYSDVWGSLYNQGTGVWAPPEQIDANGPQDSADMPATAIGTSQIVVVWHNKTTLVGGGSDEDIMSRTRSP
jgi:hypothetical protein